MSNNRDQNRYNLRPRKTPQPSEKDNENISGQQLDDHHLNSKLTNKLNIKKLTRADIITQISDDVADDVVERVVELILNEANVSEETDDESDEHDEDYKINLGFTFDKDQTILDNGEWKKELTQEHIAKYKFIFENLKDKKLTLSKILDAKLTNKEKEKMVREFIYPLGMPHEEAVQFIEIRDKQPTIDYDRLHQDEVLEEELNTYVNNRLTIKKRILDLKMDMKYKSIVWEKYQAWQQMDPGQGDYHKYSEWINWILKVPWGIYHEYITPIDNTNPNYQQELKEIVKNVIKNFDNVYGLEFPKEEVLLHVVQKLATNTKNNGKSGGQILAIEGPPGVGKTYLLKQLSKSMKIPFESIPLGGCKDASYLDGHSFTYEGSMPGRIVQALKNMKCVNGIIYFDEIDKLSDSQHGQEVSSLMLHILDETQNTEFFDKYFSDIPVDLSKILFVLSINDREKIDPVLRQRLNIIKIKEPTIEDKVQISKRCMIPIMLNELQLSSEDVIIGDEAIRYIITSIAEQEEGVRSLKQKLFALCKRIFFLKHTKFQKSDKQISFAIDNLEFPVIVDRTIIDTLLANHKYDIPESLVKMYL